MQQQLLPGSTVLRFLVLSEANIKVLLYEHEIMLISRFNLLSVSFAQFCFVVIFGGRCHLVALFSPSRLTNMCGVFLAIPGGLHFALVPELDWEIH
jgi:hypothetical protein